MNEYFVCVDNEENLYKYRNQTREILLIFI